MAEEKTFKEKILAFLSKEEGKEETQEVEATEEAVTEAEEVSTEATDATEVEEEVLFSANQKTELRSMFSELFLEFMSAVKEAEVLDLTEEKEEVVLKSEEIVKPIKPSPEAETEKNILNLSSKGTTKTARITEILNKL